MAEMWEMALLARAEEVKRLGQAEGLLEAAEMALAQAQYRDDPMAKLAEELSRIGRARLPAIPQQEET